MFLLDSQWKNEAAEKRVALAAFSRHLAATWCNDTHPPSKSLECRFKAMFIQLLNFVFFCAIQDGFSFKSYHLLEKPFTDTQCVVLLRTCALV